MGSGEPLIILHGLFGMLDNWVTLGKRFSEHFEVYIVDQRNHGKSPHSTEMTYSLLADDIAAFIEEQRIDRPWILGHSMGGKTAMHYALSTRASLRGLIIADIAPKSYDVRHLDIIQALKMINPSTLKSRDEAVSILLEAQIASPIVLFLLKNLERHGNAFNWKFNLDAIEQNIENIGQAIQSTHPFLGMTLFLKGELSNYISEEDRSGIADLFPKYQFCQILGAGHWLHAEKLDAFYDAVMKFAT